MSVAFLMDEHVDSAIVRALRARGMDVLTVLEDGLAGEDDSVVLDRAGELGRVVFTLDKDFLIEAAQRQSAGIAFAGVVFASAQKLSLRQAIADLEVIGIAADPDDLANRVEYLPL